MQLLVFKKHLIFIEIVIKGGSKISVLGFFGVADISITIIDRDI